MKIIEPASSQASTYLYDSNYLIKILENAGEIKDDKCIFTADTVAMHLNIEREEVLVSLYLAFKTYVLL